MPEVGRTVYDTNRRLLRRCRNDSRSPLHLFCRSGQVGADPTAPRGHKVSVLGAACVGFSQGLNPTYNSNSAATDNQGVTREPSHPMPADIRVIPDNVPEGRNRRKSLVGMPRSDFVA